MINLNIITTLLAYHGQGNNQDSGTGLLFAKQRECFTRQQSLLKHCWERFTLIQNDPRTNNYSKERKRRDFTTSSVLLVHLRTTI